MAERVVLHIGTPKSGTTYLQALLWDNRARLAEAGVVLPMKFRRDHNQSAGDLAGQVRRVLPGVEPTTWEQMVAGIAEARGTAVISEELLASVQEDGRRRAAESLAGTEVHIVITARDPVRQVPSMWQQTLKHRATWTLPEFAARIAAGDQSTWDLQQDVAGLVERWAEHVPPERIHVVTVPRSGADAAELWARFAQVLDIDPSSCEQPVGRANETLDSVQAEVLRRVNVALADRLDFPQPYVRVVRYQLVPALAAHRSGERIALPAEHLGWAAEYSRQTIERIKLAGVRVVGDLDELIGEAPGEPQQPATTYDEERIAALTVAALADFAVAQADRVGQVDELRAELKKVRRRLQRSRARNRELAAASRGRWSRLRSKLRRDAG